MDFNRECIFVIVDDACRLYGDTNPRVTWSHHHNSPTARMLRLSLRHTNFQIHLLPQFYETTVLKPTPIVFDVYEYVLSTLETVISRRWIHIGIVTFRKYAR